MRDQDNRLGVARH